MKNSWWNYKLIISLYFGFCGFLVAYPPRAIWSEFFVLSLYVVLPMGLGLVLLRVFNYFKYNRNFPKSYIVLSAIFVGSVLLPVLLELAEIFDVMSLWLPYLFVFIMMLSLGGYLVWGDELWKDCFFKESGRKFFILTPLILFFYYYRYWFFSPYPFRDLFQDCLFMKATLELSRYGILNPQVGDTYIPLIQSHLGILHRFYEFDILRAQWILPFILFPVHFLCSDIFISTLTPHPKVRMVALGLTLICRPTIFTYNNGNLAVSMFLFYFVLLIYSLKLSPKLSSVLRVLGSLAAVAILFWFMGISFISIDFLGKYGLLVFFLGMCFRINSLQFLLVFLMMVGLGYHRTSQFLIAISIFLSFCYWLVFISGYKINWTKALNHLSFFLLSIVSIATIFYLLMRYGIFDLDLKTVPGPVLWVANTILRYKMDVGDPIAFGGGMRNAVGEWLRGNTLFLQGVFVLVLLIVVRKNSTLHKLKLGGDDFQTTFLKTLAFSCYAYSFLTLLFVSPFPYLYRGLPVLQIMGACAMGAGIIWVLEIEFKNNNTRVIYGGGCLLVGYAVTRYIYFHFMKNLAVKFPYIAALHPLDIFLVVLSAVVGLLLFIIKEQKFKEYVFIALILLVFSYDHISVGVRFYDKSYQNPPKDNPITIAHYTKREIEMARTLGPLKVSQLFVSDPATIAIFKAVTGNSGIVSFSNINVLDVRGRFPLAELIKKIKNGVNPKSAIEVFPYIGGEARYIFDHKLHRSIRSLWHIKDELLFVLSQRTFKWSECIMNHISNCPVEYYSDNAEISKEVLLNIKKHFIIVNNWENKVLIAKLNIKPDVESEQGYGGYWVKAMEIPLFFQIL